MVGKRNLIFLCWSQQKVGIQSYGDQFIDTYRVYISHIRAVGGGGLVVKHSYSTKLNYIFHNFSIVFLTGSYLDLSLFLSVEPCKSLRVINGFAGENKFFTRALWIGGTRLDKPLQL